MLLFLLEVSSLQGACFLLHHPRDKLSLQGKSMVFPSCLWLAGWIGLILHFSIRKVTCLELHLLISDLSGIRVMFWPLHASFFFSFLFLCWFRNLVRKLGLEKWNQTLFMLLADIKHDGFCLSHTVNSFQSISHLHLMWSQQPVDKGRTEFISWGAKAATISASNIFHIMIHIGKWKNIHIYVHTCIYVHTYIIHISISLLVSISLWKRDKACGTRADEPRDSGCPGLATPGIKVSTPVTHSLPKSQEVQA